MAIRFSIYKKITGIFRVSSSRLSPYISRCQKMSERVVSGDRWRCGRSSNKARGINRNVGWFFIGGCFSRCRREGLSRPYRPTSLSVGLSVCLPCQRYLAIHFAREKKHDIATIEHYLICVNMHAVLTVLTHAFSFSHPLLISFFQEKTKLIIANEISQKQNSRGRQLSKSLLMLGIFIRKEIWNKIARFLIQN